MPKFDIDWVKRYYRVGIITVEADSAEEAESLVWNMDHEEWGEGWGLEHEESEIETVTEVKT